MRISRFISATLLILIVCSCSVKQEDQQAEMIYSAALNQFFNSIDNFSGNVLVAHHGQVIYSQSFGYSNRELLVENKPETKFRIGSISKPITAFGIMILQEKGLVRVEEKLSTYMSDIPVSWEEITIHQLLTHTSGLGNLEDIEEPRNNLCLPTTVEGAFELFKKVPLIDVPGKDFHYSNIGYFILSLLIEKVTDHTYDSFIQEEIFRKLQMDSSGGDNPSQILKNRAQGYQVDTTGIVINSGYDNMTIKRGAGHMYSTVSDLLKLDKAFEANVLITNKSLDEMMTPHHIDTELGNDIWYGYGFDIIRNDSVSAVFHTGGVSGFECVFHKFPEKDIVIVACANIRPNNHTWRTELPQLIFRLLTVD